MISEQELQENNRLRRILHDKIKNYLLNLKTNTKIFYTNEIEYLTKKYIDSPDIFLIHNLRNNLQNCLNLTPANIDSYMNDICILNFQDINIVKDLIRFFDNDLIDVQKNEIINLNMQLKEMENEMKKNFEEVKQIQNEQSKKILMVDEDLTDVKKNTNSIEGKVDDLKQKQKKALPTL